MYPHIFRCLAYWRRSYVDRGRKGIANSFIVNKVFHESLMSSISLLVVHAYCLVWITTVDVLCPFKQFDVFNYHTPFSLEFSLEKNLWVVWPNTARLFWAIISISLTHRLDNAFCVAFAADHFIPDFISGWTPRMQLSAISWALLSFSPVWKDLGIFVPDYQQQFWKGQE